MSTTEKIIQYAKENIQLLKEKINNDNTIVSIDETDEKEKLLRVEIKKILKGLLSEEKNLSEDKFDIAQDRNLTGVKKRAYKTTAFGNASKWGGKSFKEIAKELDLSVSGAEKLTAQLIKKLRFVYAAFEQDPEGIEQVILTALNDYIEYLIRLAKSNGDPLTDDEIEDLKAHPEILEDEPLFKIRLKKYIDTYARDVIRSKKVKIEPDENLKDEY